MPNWFPDLSKRVNRIMSVIKYHPQQLTRQFFEREQLQRLLHRYMIGHGFEI